MRARHACTERGNQVLLCPKFFWSETSCGRGYSCLARCSVRHQGWLRRSLKDRCSRKCHCCHRLLMRHPTTPSRGLVKALASIHPAASVLGRLSCWWVPWCRGRCQVDLQPARARERPVLWLGRHEWFGRHESVTSQQASALNTLQLTRQLLGRCGNKVCVCVCCKCWAAIVCPCWLLCRLPRRVQTCCMVTTVVLQPRLHQPLPRSRKWVMQSKWESRHIIGLARRLLGVR